MVTVRDLKRIRVKEALSVEADAGNERIVHDLLHDVAVLGLSGIEKHPVRPVDRGDLCAGLAVCRVVRQFVSISKGFSAASGSDSAGDVEFLFHDVFPDTQNGLFVRFVAGECRDVGDPAVHIARTDGVSNGFILFDDRFVVLRVRSIRRVGSSFGASAQVKEVFRQIEVLFFTGQAVEFDQSHFDFLMSRRPVLGFAVAERFADEVRRFERNVEQIAFPRREMVRIRRFVKMPETVKFVSSRIAPAFQTARRRDLSLFCLGILVDRAHGVEVTVRFLCGCDLRDDVVHVRVEFRILLNGEQEGCPLEHFVDVGIIPAADSLKLSFKCPGSSHKIADTSVFLAFLKRKRDRFLTSCVDAGFPETGRNVRLRKRDRSDAVLVRNFSRICKDRTGGGKQQNQKQNGKKTQNETFAENFQESRHKNSSRK